MIARGVLVGLAFVMGPSSTTAAVPAGQVVPVRDTTFRHDRHQGLQCLECHKMQSEHGAQIVQDMSDCRGCHHTGERLDDECAACHRATDMKFVVHPIRRTFTLTVNDLASSRELPFRHIDHEERDCSECHVSGPSLAVPELDCQGCHEEHHAETASGCLSCHRQPAEDAHTLAVHLTCSGSGCHQESPFDGPPRNRPGCIWCHEDKVDHEPDEVCSACHLLSGPTAAGAAPTFLPLSRERHVGG